MMPRSPAFIGALCATIAAVFFSINDSAIKFLSDGYALHQVVLIRSCIGLFFVLVLIAPLTDGWSITRTRKLHLHLLRGMFVVTANMLFFLGLAAMPLAEAVAIFFISPLVITVFSVIFLREQVGPRRWAAIAVGLVGVLIIVRPGTDAFQIASLLPMTAAISYAALHVTTRKIGQSDSAATMAFYIQIVFIVVCIGVGLALGDGKFADQGDPSLAFLLRPWGWPEAADLPVFLLIGFGVAIGGYCISQAYRVAEAGYIAPFEYLAMPLAVLFGYLVFDEVPDGTTVIGAILIVGSGLFTVWREGRVGQAAPTPKVRR